MSRYPNLIYRRRLFAAAAALLACGCGGSEEVTAPPTPVEAYTVVVTVYEDENRDGRLGADETLWVPDVEIEIGGKVGRSGKRSGRTVVEGVPRGTYTVKVRASSLPPYYEPVGTVSVESPQAADANVKIPVMLPVGNDMIPGKYFASGDSISQGEGSRSGEGFRPALQDKLLDHFGRCDLRYRGGGGGRTADAVARLARDMESIRPAYTLLNWGVNDFHEEGCSNPANTSCLFSSNLKNLFRQVRSWGSLPLVSTLIPCNPADTERCPAVRNDWVKKANDVVRAVARDERVVVIESGEAFFKASSLPSLFTDHVHPNDAGYAVLTEAYFQALTHGTLAASGTGFRFGFAPPRADTAR